MADTETKYQDYLKQIDALRTLLLAKVDGIDNALATDLVKYYQNVKNTSDGFISTETSIHNTSTNQLASYYNNDVRKKTGEGLSKAVANKVVAEVETLAYYQIVAARRNALLKGGVIAPSIPLESATSEFAFLNKQPVVDVPSNIQDLYAANDIEAEKNLKYFKDHNVNIFPSGLTTGIDEFPKPGEDVPGHDPAFGQTFASNLTYNIGGTPTQPAQKLFKSWQTVPKGTVNSTATPDSPFLDRLDQMLEDIRKQQPGSYKFFIEKLHGKSSQGVFFKKNPIDKSKTAIDFPNRMVFPAYVSAFNDSYDSTWGDYKFIGRGEKVYSWEETARSLTLEFYMMSDYSAELLLAAVEQSRKETEKKQTNSINDAKNKLTKTVSSTSQGVVNNIKAGQSPDLNKVGTQDDEKIKEYQRLFPNWGEGTTPNPSYARGDRNGFIPGQLSGTPEQMYERATFLAQCCYGWYRKDGKLKEQPFIRVRIADFFDVICKINSLNLTEDEFDVDLNPSTTTGAIPMGIKVSMNMTIIHEDEASSEYRKFYHRLDYDENVADPKFKPQSGKETSQFKDTALDQNTTGSPLHDLDSLSSYGEGNLQFPKKVTAYQEALHGFNGSLKDLSNSQTNLNDFVKRERLKNSLINAKKLLELGQKLDLEQIKPPTQTANGDSGSLANTPTSDNFKSGSSFVPKLTDVPIKTKQLFPKFGTPDV